MSREAGAALRREHLVRLGRQRGALRGIADAGLVLHAESACRQQAGQRPFALPCKRKSFPLPDGEMVLMPAGEGY